MLSEFEKLNGKMVFGQFKKGAKNLKDFDCKHSPIVKKISYLENINKTLELQYNCYAIIVVKIEKESKPPV